MTSVAIVVQGWSWPAGAEERAHSVVADLLTIVCPQSAFVDVWAIGRKMPCSTCSDGTHCDEHTVMLHWPLQVLPSASSLYPVLHTHRYDPRVLTHRCSQPWLGVAHSIISTHHSSSVMIASAASIHLTITRAPVCVEGVTSIAAACVGAHSIVAVLITAVSPSWALIYICKGSTSRWRA